MAFYHLLLIQKWRHIKLKAILLIRTCLIQFYPPKQVIPVESRHTGGCNWVGQSPFVCLVMWHSCLLFYVGCSLLDLVPQLQHSCHWQRNSMAISSRCLCKFRWIWQSCALLMFVSTVWDLWHFKVWKTWVSNWNPPVHTKIKQWLVGRISRIRWFTILGIYL